MAIAIRRSTAVAGSSAAPVASRLPAAANHGWIFGSSAQTAGSIRADMGILVPPTHSRVGSVEPAWRAGQVRGSAVRFAHHSTRRSRTSASSATSRQAPRLRALDPADFLRGPVRAFSDHGAGRPLASDAPPRLHPASITECARQAAVNRGVAGVGWSEPAARRGGQRLDRLDRSVRRASVAMQLASAFVKAAHLPSAPDRPASRASQLLVTLSVRTAATHVVDVIRRRSLGVRSCRQWLPSKSG